MVPTAIPGSPSSRCCLQSSHLSVSSSLPSIIAPVNEKAVKIVHFALFGLADHKSKVLITSQVTDLKEYLIHFLERG